MVRCLAASLAASILGATPATAENWIRITSTSADNKGTTHFYVDVDSVNGSGGIYTYWNKLENTAPDRNSGTTQMIAQERVDCIAELSETTRLIIYKSDGSNVSIEGDGTLIPIAPGTIERRIFEAVCGMKGHQI
ncbi:surface-adhesin E family protein [Sphingomonas arenae]